VATLISLLTSEGAGKNIDQEKEEKILQKGYDIFFKKGIITGKVCPI
jgi:hypothetical protein